MQLYIYWQGSNIPAANIELFFSSVRVKNSLCAITCASRASPSHRRKHEGCLGHSFSENESSLHSLLTIARSKIYLEQGKMYSMYRCGKLFGFLITMIRQEDVAVFLLSYTDTCPMSFKPMSVQI